FDMSSNRSAVKVLLHASTDGGRTYNQVAAAVPSKGSFIYTAPADGWYFFVVQVQDVEGRLTPANVKQVPPGLRVCVDPQRPRIMLKPVQPGDGTVAVEWQVSDEKAGQLDLRTLRLGYRPAGGKIWTALNTRRALQHARFDWTPPAAGNYEV